MKGFFVFAQVPSGYPKVILAGRFPYENAGKLRMVQVRVSFPARRASSSVMVMPTSSL